MNKDRHGICDGCDRSKPLVLVHGRGLCVNCETLWGEAQRAMLEEIVDDLESGDEYDYRQAQIYRKKYGVK